MRNSPLTYDIAVRYFDIDANNHVNNSVYFTYMEEARTHLLLEHFLKWDKEGLKFVVTEATCKYKKPISLLDKVSIKISTDNVKGVSFDINYAFADPSGQLYAEGKTRLACVDKKTQKLVRLPEEIIDILRD
jgi:acyl-CoA thioester hydrolase